MDQIFRPGYLVESAPSTGASTDAMKSSSTPTPTRRRLLKKRVILTPIQDSEGSRLKGEGTPPTDSWAWRKYGQKPIKGSPYPRGYYRCSSSKGCPARKQVERSRDDPTMLVITYSCEHNHPWPMPRNNHHHHHHHQKATAAASTTDDAPSKSETSDISTLNREAEQEQELEPKTEPEPGEKFAHIKDELPLMPVEDEFGWFADMEMTNSSLMMSPFLYRKTFWDDRDMALLRPTREEDESLFADLGELPECSVVFRHLDVGTQVQIC